ncbi:MAG TPA: penicillin-binding transpeptidase domain-containing protein, partial [Candidatus Paceibacterota bacterium]|nr:penicillin-binding transpeptidase domain-containing protein [Candidatus Paceibacterota bacterium]
MIGKRRRSSKDWELAPDEIFLDSSNLPDFDAARLEGRLERPVSRTTFFGLGGGVALLILVLIIQAVNLELVKGSAYAAQSERNRLRPEVIFAERGAITDRNGTPLAWNEAGEEGFPERVFASPGYGHILGYVSYPEKDKSGNYYETEIEGVAGIERAFNGMLAGVNGTLLVEEDARGTIESQGSIVAAKNGETLMLSIDARVQEAFAGAIKELADKIPFKGGSGILMDVETGEILALVSYPEYDPNVLSSGKDHGTIVSYNNDSREPYLDRAVSGLYTPGSIVKPMIAAGAFNDGIISAEKAIVSTGSISLPNPYDPSKPSIFKDWKAHGATDMRHAIAVSSDVYFYTVGGGFGDQKGLGIDRLNYWYKAFGFLSETGIEIE